MEISFFFLFPKAEKEEEREGKRREKRERGARGEREERPEREKERDRERSEVRRMIRCFLIINNFGKPRLIKFYERLTNEQRQVR